MKDKNTYQSLSGAVAALQEQGYTENLTFCATGLENKGKSCVYPAGSIHVDAYYRFEGKTNPADNSILYAIRTTDGHKGLLVDAYGAYSGSIPPEIIEKLKVGR